MRQSIRIGSIAGIPVGANWSVLVVTVLITWLLAAGILPELEPDQPTGAYVAAAVIAAALFFVSLVLHELAHSMVARRYGVGVRAITLWLFGGVSELESETSSPGEELRMAVAGPLTSIGLAVVFFAVSVLGDLASWPVLVVAAAWWLGFVNAAIGVFNLLPAYPMDGGRVLRAALWARTGDRVQATLASARTGRWFAYGLIGLGVLLAVSGAFLSGVWLMFIGWFLEGASRMESLAVVQQGILGEMRAGQLMSAPPVTVPADISVEHLVDEYVLGRHHSAFPVVDRSGAPIGLVGLAQVRGVTPAERRTTPVGAVTQPLTQVPVVAPDDTGAEVLRRLTEARASRALVVDRSDHLVGIVSNTDLARAIEVGSQLPPGR